MKPFARAGGDRVANELRAERERKDARVHTLGRRRAGSDENKRRPDREPGIAEGVEDPRHVQLALDDLERTSHDERGGYKQRDRGRRQHEQRGHERELDRHRVARADLEDDPRAEHESDEDE